MEDFQRKRQYLNHLKQISAIRNGHYKSSINLQTSRAALQNPLNLRQNGPQSFVVQSRLKLTKSPSLPLTSRGQTTQQIMKNYYMQKQNLRLVQRIGTINSGINMRRYQKQYNQHKKIMKIHSKFKKPDDYYNFKIFDIQFQQNIADPDQIFFIYQISKQKKNSLLKEIYFNSENNSQESKKDNHIQLKYKQDHGVQYKQK